MKPVFIIAIVVVMIGVMVPSSFAISDNVVIEGNFNPINRSEELFVVKVDPSNEQRKITFSIYDSETIIFSRTSEINSGGTFQNFYVKFFPPLFQDNGRYTIEVTGPQLIGRELIMIAGEASISNEPTIPFWIKNNAGWWADGTIDDDAFIQGIQFLVKENIIQVESISQKSGDDKDIPTWVKNNAEWWTNGTIDDSTFISGIEYLVNEGIILVK